MPFPGESWLCSLHLVAVSHVALVEGANTTLQCVRMVCDAPKNLVHGKPVEQTGEMKGRERKTQRLFVCRTDDSLGSVIAKMTSMPPLNVV